ncbi:family 20 glycosylhydrolase [Chitinophaga pinensis]|uniref:beta-N-acetylhexosaminidase n=1 Tax=Chitinophaga pinensis (strain ATCC 43595 / DSM 2588 / LMG 13176 / NBRC 15968 / NCIMB 11800 / UQM 2034) TaxID=485918 RepID=A0A979GRW3_CHIPD|nr:family 20 glycosylhydrolase [Chitinophaga pinensis]ACU58984.1 Beta-N-acetylhexosaminidase [Chitinophaga pinensis DSM 2588]
MHFRQLLLACGLFAGAAAPVHAQAPFDASRIKVSWEVVENNHQGKAQFLSAFTLVNNSKVPFPAQGWQLYFNFVRSIKPGPFAGGVTAAHVNGDLYKLAPVAAGKGIAPGDSLRIEIVADAWAVNFTDAPDGLYLVWDKEPGKGYRMNPLEVRPSTQPKQYLRFPGDKTALTTAADVFEQNKDIKDIPVAQLPAVFPTPQEVIPGTGTYTLQPGLHISAAPAFAKEAAYLAGELNTLFGTTPAIGEGNGIALQQDGSLAKEAYTLTITTDGIVIKAADAAGIFYGIQTLKSILPANAWAAKQKTISLAAIQVKDAPRYPYRAFMLDVARNFHSKQDVLRLLEVMSLYKLNVLHFHLTDDEGWRIEIPSLPELTQVGGRRGHGVDEKESLLPSYGSGPDVNDPAGSGFFTKQDFLEILKYATARHITVIPEIETPGHARAAVKAMEARYAKFQAQGKTAEATQYLLSDFQDKSVYHSVQNWNDNVINVALPSVYTFLDKVVEELQAYYKEADAPLEYVHMGGDEVPAGVWQQSPVVRALMQQDKSIRNTDDLWYYYYGKVYDLLKARGLKQYGWEEMGMRKTTVGGKPHNIPNPQFSNNEFMVDVWNNVMGGGAEDLPYRLANANYKVVLSGVSNLYFDMAYMKSFEEPGFYWGGFVDIDKPFYFIPEDYYKNSKVDALGNRLNPAIFQGKDKLTAYGAENIVGVQGLLWSETVKNSDRMEYMILPKLFGLAERAWAKNPDWAIEKDSARSEELYGKAWNNFVNVVGKKELVRLDHYNGGYNYRIPTPGLKLNNGSVAANIQLPGFTIRYTTDGKEPNSKSKVYTGPVAEKGTLKFKAFDTRGRSSRTATTVNPLRAQTLSTDGGRK